MHVYLPDANDLFLHHVFEIPEERLGAFFTDVTLRPRGSLSIDRKHGRDTKAITLMPHNSIGSVLQRTLPSAVTQVGVLTGL